MADLYDVNALLALFDEEHEKHDLVNAWFDRNLEQGWASCPLTQNGYLRIRSQPNYSRPLILAEAYEQLLDATSSQHHQFIASSPTTSARLTIRLYGFVIGRASPTDRRLPAGPRYDP